MSAEEKFGESWIKLQAGLGYFDRVIAELQDTWDRRRTITEEERNELAVKTLALRYHTARLALELTQEGRLANPGRTLDQKGAATVLATGGVERRDDHGEVTLTLKQTRL